MTIPRLPQWRPPSIARVFLGVALSVLVPTVAWLVDPGLDGAVNKILLGAFVILFVIGDSFSSGTIAGYANLTNSSALTFREMQKLQAQLRSIRSDLRRTWWIGMGLRAAHTILLSALLAQEPGPIAVQLTLVGYMLLGLSLAVVISLASTFWQADHFQEEFRIEERREKERERLLARAH